MEKTSHYQDVRSACGLSSHTHTYDVCSSVQTYCSCLTQNAQIDNRNCTSFTKAVYYFTTVFILTAWLSLVKWNSQSFNLIILPKHPGEVISFAFNSSQTVISAGGVNEWSLVNGWLGAGKCSRLLTQTQQWLDCAFFSVPLLCQCRASSAQAAQSGFVFCFLLPAPL